MVERVDEKGHPWTEADPLRTWLEEIRQRTGITRRGHHDIGPLPSGRADPNPYCTECGENWPCAVDQLAREVLALVEVAEAAEALSSLLCRNTDEDDFLHSPRCTCERCSLRAALAKLTEEGR